MSCSWRHCKGARGRSDTEAPSRVMQAQSQAGSQQSNTAKVSENDSAHGVIVPLTTAHALTVRCCRQCSRAEFRGSIARMAENRNTCAANSLKTQIAETCFPQIADASTIQLLASVHATLMTQDAGVCMHIYVYVYTNMCLWADSLARLVLQLGATF